MQWRDGSEEGKPVLSKWLRTGSADGVAWSRIILHDSDTARGGDGGAAMSSHHSGVCPLEKVPELPKNIIL